MQYWFLMKFLLPPLSGVLFFQTHFTIRLLLKLLLLLLWRSEILAYVYQRSTPSGMLYVAFSNVSIISSKFMHNRADIGGALVAHNSSLYLARSTYSNNTANFGGVMVTSGSTIDMLTITLSLTM